MNLLEPGLAFLEGLALIVSPCILPVLPLVLSTSIEGGKKRPFGIITGFVLSFTLFALLSRKLVTALNIDLDIIKNASLVLLFAFGIILLSSKLSEKFSALTQGAANIGSRVGTNGQGGYFSGIGIGALIGLVWTPCAGPILASVLVQVIRQQTDIAGFFIMLSFALGAGVPMLIIALTGRKIMAKLGFFTKHAEAIRKTFGVLILFSVAFIASGVDAESLFSSKKSQGNTVAGGLQNPLAKPYAAPEFAGIEAWLNSKPLTMKALKGKVVLIDFWTYSCINCVRTLPYITEWDKKYRNKGLVIIGVHAPEFEFEKKQENVSAAIKKHGILYPVALDNTLSTWGNFNNQYWPAHYLITKEGQVVYTHFGEGNYDITENNIRYLLGITDKVSGEAEDPGMQQPPLTPETYLGFSRAEHFGGTKSTAPNSIANYTFPKFLAIDSWALNGSWKVQAEKIIAQEKGASLQLNFRAQKVFLVLGSSTGKPVHATIRLNGDPAGAAAGADAAAGNVTINGNTLYELIDQKNYKNSLLEIKAAEPGLEAYAFTFGG